ncbi:FGGY family carbohydrate kinase [uncultured Thioclava sp.]|uniref:xylulokinase n=1 Tax=uncultured Thioclava sp. TaxID=473858 RepID=UPI0025E84A50|nr:FGGY family carbohydrate kinase [uncultured Thioclava sp.]
MIIVLNLGLKSVRSIIYNEQGMRIANAGRRVNSRLNGELVEQDAHEWRTKLMEVLRESIDVSGLGGKIKYVTVACSASCLVPVDRSLVPKCRVIMVSDKRARDQAARISQSENMVKLAQKYGYKASEYSQISRMLWLKENDPAAYEGTWKFLAPNDYLTAVLTGGQAVTDQLNAEKNFFDTEAGSYPDALYDEFGLDTGKLPERVDIGTNVGKLDKTLLAEAGITSDPDMIVGTYDAICSVFGTGVSAPGQVCDVSGTVTSVRMYSDKPFHDDKGRIMCQHFPPSNGYLFGGSNNLGGGLIEWAKTCLYTGDENPYEKMQIETEGDGSFGSNRTGLVFLPHLLGARAPSWNSDARGIFFGLERHHTRGDLMRSIFESVAFSIRDFLEIFHESETSPEMITASGGLATIRIANEIKASITGLPYHFMAEFESTSLGAAIIVMCSQGRFESYQQACEQIVATKQIFLPRAQDKQYYDDMYGLYTELSIQADPLFQKRKVIMEKHRISVGEFVENL